jgi:hypothetical protein
MYGRIMKVNSLIKPAKLGSVPAGIDVDKVIEVTELVIDWEDFWAVHQWFVQNAQHGEDHQLRQPVQIWHLERLMLVLDEILRDRTLAQKRLPNNADYMTEDQYWNEVARTKKALSELLSLSFLEPGYSPLLRWEITLFYEGGDDL